MPDRRSGGAIVRALPGRAAPRRLPTGDGDLDALVRAARAGDSAAWTRLVERFDHVVRGVARSFRLAPADVDDVAQETWLRLFRHLDSLRQPAALPGWLTTTARRISLRQLQSPVRELLTDDPRVGDQVAGERPESQLLAAERRAILAGAVATLPERHRRLITLLAADPTLAYQQISALLGMPIGSIGPIRARCLRRLAMDPQLRALRATAAAG
jgi:RNA polymerase sigma factor (sigma-70 family)